MRELEKWCAECRGTGRCLICGGVRFSETAGDRFRCGSCSGSGVCPACKGITFDSRETELPSQGEGLDLVASVVEDLEEIEEHDRREQKRFQLRLHVDVGGSGSSYQQVAWTSDISRGGALLQLSEEPARGERLELTVRLPNDEIVLLPCKVMHVSMEVVRLSISEGDYPRRFKRFLVGVHFEYLTPAQEAAVDSVMAMMSGK